MGSTSFGFPRDILNVGDLSQNTGEDVKNLSRLDALLSDAREVAQRNTGLLLIVAAQAFFAVADATVKILRKVDPPVTTMQVMTIRMIITYIGCMIYIFIAKIPDPFMGPKGVRILLLMRGVGGFIGIFGTYYSLRYLSLSDATVLNFLAPTCTAISGAIFLGESFKFREAMAGFVSSAGVVLIARPAALFGDYGETTIPSNADKVTASDRMKAVVVSLIGVLGVTLAYTTIRAIGKRAHPMHAMAFLSTVSILMASVGMMVSNMKIIIPTRLDSLSLLAVIGEGISASIFFGTLSDNDTWMLLTMGLQRETAGRGSLAVYSLIVFATMLEWILFHTLPSYLSVAGTLMIVVSALYIVLTKEKTKATIDQPIRLTVLNDEALQQGFALSSRRT